MTEPETPRPRISYDPGRSWPDPYAPDAPVPSCPHLGEMDVLRSRMAALKAEVDIMAAEAERVARLNDRLLGEGAGNSPGRDDIAAALQELVWAVDAVGDGCRRWPREMRDGGDVRLEAALDAALLALGTTP